MSLVNGYHVNENYMQMEISIIMFNQGCMDHVEVIIILIIYI